MRGMILVIGAIVLCVACARTAPETKLPARFSFDDLWDYGDPAATEARFRSLLETAGDGDGEYTGQLLTQIARCQGLQGQFGEAEATLVDAERTAGPHAPVAQVRVSLERGRVLNSSGEPDKAQPLFQTAFDQASARGYDDFAADAAHMLAIVTAGDESVSWNEKALAIARASKDPKAQRWSAPVLNNLGWTYFDMGKYDAALRAFGEALGERVERGDPEPILIARWAVARTLRALGQYENALQMQQSILDDRNAASLPEDGYVSQEIAENLLALDRAGEAAPVAAHAVELLGADPWVVKNEADELARLRAIADGKTP